MPNTPFGVPADPGQAAQKPARAPIPPTRPPGTPGPQNALSAPSRPVPGPRGFGSPAGVEPLGLPSRQPAGPRGFGTPAGVEPLGPPAPRQVPSRPPGTPTDPAQAAPRPERRVPPERKPLASVQAQPVAAASLVLTPLTLGLNVRDNPLSLPVGATPDARNFLAKEQGIEPRWRLGALGSVTTNLWLNGDQGMGCGEYVSTLGVRTPFALSTRTFMFYSSSAWTSGSYGTQPVNDPLAGSNTDYFDSAVIYLPRIDDNILVLTNGVDQSLVWQGPSTRTFSTLTSAPIARYVTGMDNRAIFGYVVSGSTSFSQRVQWSVRGDPEDYSVPDGGFEELVDLRGRITRVLSQGDRLLVFSEQEIWAGYKSVFPFNFQFSRLVSGIGCTAPWSIVETPRGIIFLGSNYQVYAISTGGLPEPIGQSIWPLLRDTVDNIARSSAVYNTRTGQYELYYPIQGGSGRPERALFLDLDTGVFAPQRFAHALNRVADIALASSATQWNQLVGTFDEQTLSYSQLGGSTDQRTVMAVTSAGSMLQYASTATSDGANLVDCRWMSGALLSDDPFRKSYVREIRLDYKAASASSLTLRVSDNYGASYLREIAVALPIAAVSAQTTVHLGATMQYPIVEVVHDQGHRFTIQRIALVSEPAGYG